MILMKKELIIHIAISMLYTSSFLVKGNEIDDIWTQTFNLERQGEYAKAAAIIEPLLNGDENREYVLLRYAWLAYQQRNHNDAVRYYKQALKINPASIDARLGLSLPLLAQSDWNTAEVYLRQIVTISPWNYTAHSRLFACEEGLQQWEQLASHADAFSRHYPGDATALVYLARAKHKIGDKVTANEVYQQVLIRMPTHIEAINYTRTFQNITRK
jgi:tetratricopeptide (TPR) repeat protein